MNALLESIANNASDDLRRLIEEGEKDILNAIYKAQEEAQLQETAPKFNLGFKIAVDLDKSTFECCLSWSLKQSLSVSHQIEDPKQGKLPIGDALTNLATIPAKHGIDSMTISTPTQSVTITKEDAERIAANATSPKRRGKK